MGAPRHDELSLAACLSVNGSQPCRAGAGFYYNVRVLFVSPSGAWVRAARRSLWVSSLALVLWLLQSAIWASRVPVPLRVLVGGTAVLAALRPAGALLAVAVLVPISHVLITRVWNAHPFALAESLVLAFFAGYLWSERRRLIAGATESDVLTLPSRLFTLVVLASCLVHLAVLQVWHDYPVDYATGFVQFLGNEYLSSIPDPRYPPGQPGLFPGSRVVG